MSWQDQIEVSAAAALAEIKAMAESANRSIGQRFRYLRERVMADHFNRMSIPDLQRIVNLSRSAMLQAMAIANIQEVPIGRPTKRRQQWHQSTK